jgi:hypothetical protein
VVFRVKTPCIEKIPRFERPMLPPSTKWRWYRTTSPNGVLTRKKVTWIFIAVKIPSLAKDDNAQSCKNVILLKLLPAFSRIVGVTCMELFNLNEQ